MNKLLFTGLEAANMMGVCERTLANARRRGDLPYVLLGRSVRYKPEDLEGFIQKQRRRTRHVSIQKRRFAILAV